MSRPTLWLALTLSALVTACGDGSGSSTSRLVEIQVTPANPSISVGSVQQFSAIGRYSNGTSNNLVGTVTWASSNNAVATIAQGGNATAKVAGSTSITATTDNITGTATLIVTGPVLVSIAITPSTPSITVGSTLQFTATGTYDDGSKSDLTKSATWGSSTVSVATITNSGLAQAIAAGTSTITATSGGISGAATLEVTASTLTSILVGPAAASIPLGIRQQFTATGSFSDGTIKDISDKVVWSSSKSTVASISAAGLATARNLGNTVIKAISGGVDGSTTLNVNAANLSSITIVDGDVTIAKNTSHQFRAIGLFNDGGTRNISTSVTWTSSKQDVAAIGVHNPIAKGIASGFTIIAATLNGVSTSVTLDVTDSRIQFISVTPTSPTIAATTEIQFLATGTFDDSTTQDLGFDVMWSSSNHRVATVTSTGIASAVAKGSATINASFGGATGSAILNISNATLISITISPEAALIAPASTQPFGATGTFSNGTKQILTTQVAWSSSDKGVATITPFGLATGLSAGNTRVSAGLAGINASPADLVVTSSPLKSIEVVPAIGSVPQQIGTSFTAIGTFEDSTKQDLTSAVTWTSSSPAIATISNIGGFNGVATGLSPGQATITAVFRGVVGAAIVHVTNATLTSIAVSPSSPDVAAGSTVQFIAIGHFSDSTTLVLTTQVDWASSDSTIAVISSTGAANTVATGIGKNAIITASLNGITGTATLSVH